MPVLIGAFVGAPVLARELETGTFRFAWTQGFGRARWAVGQAGAAGGRGHGRRRGVQRAVRLVHPAVPGRGREPAKLAPGRVFDLQGVAFAAWTLAAFAIGALAGVLIRRVVPAMAATLAVYAGLAFATTLWLRQHYLAPLVTNNPEPALATALPVSQWYTGANGKLASQAVISHVLQGFQPAVTRKSGRTRSRRTSPRRSTSPSTGTRSG